MLDILNLIIPDNVQYNYQMCIEHAHKYMLTNDFKEKCNVEIPNSNVNELTINSEQINNKTASLPIHVDIVEKSCSPNQITSEYIYPVQRDTLFWCIYIASGNYNEYININRNYGVKELELKYKIYEYFVKNVHQIKDTNYNKTTKITIQEILSELITNINKTSMHCIIALIIYFKVNIIITDDMNKTMLEFIYSTDVSTYRLQKCKYGKYHTDITPLTENSIYELKEKFICLESYKKTLKPMSSYKVLDLEKMIYKLGIEIPMPKYNKLDLYEILQKNVKIIL